MEREAFLQVLENQWDQPVFKRLRQILSEDLDRALRTRYTDYACPSWSHSMAHRNGMVEAFEAFKTLMDNKND